MLGNHTLHRVLSNKFGVAKEPPPSPKLFQINTPQIYIEKEGIPNFYLG